MKSVLAGTVEAFALASAEATIAELSRFGSDPAKGRKAGMTTSIAAATGAPESSEMLLLMCYVV